jgi:hypothetical protein
MVLSQSAWLASPKILAASSRQSTARCRYQDADRISRLLIHERAAAQKMRRRLNELEESPARGRAFRSVDGADYRVGAARIVRLFSLCGFNNYGLKMARRFCTGRAPSGLSRVTAGKNSIAEARARHIW